MEGSSRDPANDLRGHVNCYKAAAFCQRVCPRGAGIGSLMTQPERLSGVLGFAPLLGAGTQLTRLVPTAVGAAPRGFVLPAPAEGVKPPRSRCRDTAVPCFLRLCSHNTNSAPLASRRLSFKSQHLITKLLRRQREHVSLPVTFGCSESICLFPNRRLVRFGWLPAVEVAIFDHLPRAIGPAQ